MSGGTLTLLIGGILLVVALLGTGVFLGARAILNNFGFDGLLGGGAGSISLGQQADAYPAPTHRGAFLDDRYAEGVRAVEVSGDNASPLGFTSDRDTMVVMRDLAVSTDDVNAWVAIDVTSGEVVREVAAQECTAVSSHDTVVCTVFRGEIGVSDGAWAIVQFDVTSGEEVTSIAVAGDGVSGIEMLGEVGDTTIFTTLTQYRDSLENTYGLHALESGASTFAWSTAFDIDPTEGSIYNCGLVAEQTLIACSGTTGHGDTFEQFVGGIDPLTGSHEFMTEVEGEVVLAENGWLLDSLNVYGPEEVLIEYDYTGAEVGPTELTSPLTINVVPSISEYVEEPFVGYDVDMLKQLQSRSFVVVNAEGTVVARSAEAMPPSLVQPIERAADGEVVFEGVPHAVSTSGEALLHRGLSSSAGGTLVNLESGETLYEITTGGIVPRMYAAEGIISYSVDGGSVVLVPGA